MLITEIHYVKCLECEEEFPYEFSKDEVKDYGMPSFENIRPGEIKSGIIPTVVCKNCGKRIQISNFKPLNKL